MTLPTSPLPCSTIRKPLLDSQCHNCRQSRQRRHIDTDQCVRSGSAMRGRISERVSVSPY